MDRIWFDTFSILLFNSIIKLEDCINTVIFNNQYNSVCAKESLSRVKPVKLEKISHY